MAARDRQVGRFRHRRITCNARMGSRELEQHCRLDETSRDLLHAAMADLHLSARAYDRILRVARTIADLEGEEAIGVSQVGEAVGFRSLDRQLWT